MNLEGQSLRRLPDPPPNARLGSWKEIAKYLNREIRTVQRWEKTDGLPVYRLYHAKRGTVYAYSKELDEWLNSRRLNIPDSEDALQAMPDNRLGPGPDGLATESPAEQSHGPRSFPLWGITAIAILAVVAGAAGWALRSAVEHHGPVSTAVTDFPGDEENAALSPDGQQAAFSWNGPDGNNYDIYVIKAGEGGPKRITTAPEWDYSPAWSPAGDQIAFLRSNSATLSGTSAGIFVVNPNGGPERSVGRVKTIGVALALKKRQLAWTPDGKSLIVCGTNSDDPEGLLLVPLAGGEIRRLTLPPRGQFDLEPALAPDAGLLAFRREVGYAVSELYAVPLGKDYAPASPEHPVLPHPHVRMASPQFTAPGRLLYLADGLLAGISTDASGVARGQPRPIQTNLAECGLVSISYVPRRPGAVLCTCERDDAAVWRLDLSAPAPRLRRVIDGEGVTISPDGKGIAVEAYVENGTNVWIANIDGSSRRSLTRVEHANAGSPAWSPDGRSIAFESTVDGRAAIYVAPAGGGAPRRLTFGLMDATVPSWSRDGRSIYFALQIAGRFEVARMPAAGGQYTQITGTGGTASAESVDGRSIYYERREKECWSIRHCLRDGTRDEEIVSCMLDRAFAVAANGIYYVPMPAADGRSSIRFLNFTTRQTTTVTPIQKAQRRPIALSPDGSFLLFSQFERWGRDLVLLEGVR